MMIKTACVIVFVMLCHGCAMQDGHRRSWLGADKAAHFATSAAMAAVVTNYYKNDGRGDCSAARIGISVSISAGALKELYDKKIKGTYWSREDFGWDILGATVGGLAASNC